MQLTPIGANQTELSLNDGTQVLFSYRTPVAARLPDYEYVRTTTKWSTTTSRHINKWLPTSDVLEVSDTFLKQLAGDN